MGSTLKEKLLSQTYCPYRWLLIIMAFVVLCGCTSNPVTGRSQLALISEKAAIENAASAYFSLVGQLASKGKIERGTPRADRVQEITNRLIVEAVRMRPEAASWNWSVVVINEPNIVNAFCAAGGKMGIYTGFWDKLHATDDEIAHVMGHEISHALAGHSAEKMSVAIAAGIGAAVIAGMASRNSNDPYAYRRNQDIASIVASLGITLPNSREAEIEADQIGIELAAKAGFEPAAAVSLWKKMAALGGRPLEFFSTHPSPENRAQNLQALLVKVNPLYQQAINRNQGLKSPTYIGRRDELNTERTSGFNNSASVPMAPQALAFAPQGSVTRESKSPDLMTAVMNSDKAAVAHFLDEGANINSRINGITYLIAAIVQENIEMVKFLVSRGADINQVDSRGLSPIMYAKAGGPSALPLTIFLQEAGANDPLASR